VVGYTARGMTKVIRKSLRRKRHPSIKSGLNAPDTFMNHIVSPQRRYAMR